jgi:hypothetical protein
MNQMPSYDDVLRFLETVLVWPTVGLALLTLFWCKIRDILIALAAFIGRIKRVSGGGFDVDLNAQQNLDKAKEAANLVTMPVPPPLPGASRSISPTGQYTPSSRLHADVIELIRNDPVGSKLAPDVRENALIHALASVRIQLAFEILYRSIFGSQLGATFQANQPGGVTREKLEADFAAAKAQYPDLHGKRTFDDWLKFILDAGLLIIDRSSGEQRYVATFRAQEFMKYMIETGLQTKYG